MELVLWIGSICAAVIGVFAVIRMVWKATQMVVRMHDSLLGDGNGTKPLRNIIVEHLDSDKNEFAQLNRKVDKIILDKDNTNGV